MFILIDVDAMAYFDINILYKTKTSKLNSEIVSENCNFYALLLYSQLSSRSVATDATKNIDSG